MAEFYGDYYGVAELLYAGIKQQVREVFTGLKESLNILLFCTQEH